MSSWKKNVEKCGWRKQICKLYQLPSGLLLLLIRSLLRTHNEGFCCCRMGFAGFWLRRVFSLCHLENMLTHWPSFKSTSSESLYRHTSSSINKEKLFYRSSIHYRRSFELYSRNWLAYKPWRITRCLPQSFAMPFGKAETQNNHFNAFFLYGL